MSSAPSGGEPQGPGACTVQGCNCPAFVGNQSSCRREYCWHGYGYRKIFQKNWSSKSRLILYVFRRQLRCQSLNEYGHGSKARQFLKKNVFENPVFVVLLVGSFVNTKSRMCLISSSALI